MNNFIARFFLLFAAVFGTLFLLVWFYLSVTSPADAAELSPAVRAEMPVVTFEKKRIRVVNPYGGGHEFDVEMAKTPDQLRRGLMFRDALAPGKGMLFVYRPPQTVGMWMKNTRIPLDMVFANRMGKIVYIFENTVPLSEKIIQAPGRTSFVLELPAGTVQSIGIEVGHRITY